MLDCFFAWRGGGLGAPGYLPFAGGYAEQPAGLMMALRHMAGCVAKLDRKR